MDCQNFVKKCQKHINQNINFLQISPESVDYKLACQRCLSIIQEKSQLLMTKNPNKFLFIFILLNADIKRYNKQSDSFPSHQLDLIFQYINIIGSTFHKLHSYQESVFLLKVYGMYLNLQILSYQVERSDLQFQFGLSNLRQFIYFIPVLLSTLEEQKSRLVCKYHIPYFLDMPFETSSEESSKVHKDLNPMEFMYQQQKGYSRILDQNAVENRQCKAYQSKIKLRDTEFLQYIAKLRKKIYRENLLSDQSHICVQQNDLQFMRKYDHESWAEETFRKISDVRLLGVYIWMIIGYEGVQQKEEISRLYQKSKTKRIAYRSLKMEKNNEKIPEVDSLGYIDLDKDISLMGNIRKVSYRDHITQKKLENQQVFNNSWQSYQDSKSLSREIMSNENYIVLF
ncbi:hypothetical protein ABPG74_007702 [Tetrahymena malaccensis]